MKDLRKLQNEVAEHLGIDPLPVKFEELGEEDSRLYLKEEYVGINIKHKNNYLNVQNLLLTNTGTCFKFFMRIYLIMIRLLGGRNY